MREVFSKANINSPRPWQLTREVFEQDERKLQELPSCGRSVASHDREVGLGQDEQLMTSQLCASNRSS